MKIITILNLVNVVFAADDVSYKYNGADWADITYTDPKKINECGTPQQSPIDLKTDAQIGRYGDSFTGAYKNVKNVMGSWTHGTTNKWDLPASDGNTFTSEFASEKWGAGKKYDAVQFHWHAGSEHTVDGMRMDLEVHTVHVAEEALKGFKYAALGVMFDRKNYNMGVTDEEVKVIDSFFDSIMKGGYSAKEVEEIMYGDLLMKLDTSNRWVYRGSVTTPPCAKSVYWNVLRAVYPIKQHHLDWFIGQMQVNTKELSVVGNWRMIQPYDVQDLMQVGTGLNAEGPLEPAYAMIIFCGLIFSVIFAWTAAELTTRIQYGSSNQQEMKDIAATINASDEGREGAQLQ